MHLRRAPIGPASSPLPTEVVVRAAARRDRTGGIEVGDLLRPQWVADVVHANPRVERPACQGGGVLTIIHAAVVRAVSEYSKTRDIGSDQRTVRGIVDLHQQSRDDLRIAL